MEPLVIFGAGLVAYCGYLTLLDSSKAWKACRLVTAAKRAPAKKRHATTGRQRQPKATTAMPVASPMLQRI